MGRKVFQISPTTLAMTLPKKWTNLQNLKKGDEVEVDEEKDSLLVTPSGKQEAPKKTTTLVLESDNRQYIKLVLTNAYRLGYDVIRLQFQKKIQFELIKEIIGDHLIGYEITSKTKDICIIESITEPPEDKVDIIIKRMFFIIKDTLAAIEGYVEGKPQDLAYLKSQTLKIDQYTYFCKRMLSKSRYEEKSYLKWTLLTYFLLIQHDCFRLIEYLQKQNIKPKKSFSNVSKQVFAFFEEYSTSYFNGDIASFSNMEHYGEKLMYGDCYNLLENNTEGAATYHLTQIVRNIYLSIYPSLGIFMSYT